jgi:Flp pilus assembly protein TadG
MPLCRARFWGDRDRGAVAVETAVVSMLLVILLFGIIESSFLFKDMISVSAAARAGARMGASEGRITGFAQDSANQVTNSLSDLNPANLQQVWVYRTTTTGATAGLPDSGSYAGGCTTCVKFSWNGTALVPTGATTWTAASQNACSGDPARDALGVYIQYKHSSGLGFFFNNQIINESTVMWVEPVTTAICHP